MSDPKPKLIETAAGDDFAETAARVFADSLRGIESPLVILPTGNTPLGMYRCLRTRYKDEPFWKNFRYLALDDYIGLPVGDERCFHSWVARELLDHVGVPAANRIVFGSVDDGAEGVKSCLAACGSADLAVLGLGENGHLGFNEPGSAFDSTVRAVDLAPGTVAANAAYWGGEDRVPRRAFTLGLRDIARSKRTILLVAGTRKAAILKATLEGPVSPEVPSTVLRTMNNVTIVADEGAMGR